jgi:hypothetical protein
VKTLARDSASSERAANRGVDKNVHLVRDNTDFRLIIEMKAEYFFEGNLPALKHYENTSLPADWQPGGDGRAWPLPYKSTIVLPIRYVYTPHDLDSLKIDGNSRGHAPLDDQDLFGFFTVDCGAREAFDERYDVELGNAIADALVPILETYSNVRERQKPK